MQKFCDSIITKLNLDSCDSIVPLKDLCNKMKISRPAYLVFTVLFVCVFMIFVGLAERMLTNVICILYPAYMSIKAMESVGKYYS